MQLAPRAKAEAGPAGYRLVGPGAVAGNPFFEPWALNPAIAHLPGGRDAGILSLAPAAGSVPVARVAAWPIARNWFSVWNHLHCFDTTAPLEADFAVGLDRLFAQLNGRGAHVLRWTTLPADTPFYRALTEWLDRRGLAGRVTRSFQRPVLAAGYGVGAADPLAHVSTKRQREFRRCRRRLEEAGRLELRVIDGPHDAALWLEDFIEIESSGWKGEAGTAFAGQPSELAFFRALVRGAARQGRCLVYSLELAGRSIAMSVNFRRGDCVWAFKTAYRHEWARLAPGALLEFEATAAAIADPTIAWIDSCTSRGGGLMEELWLGRRPVVDLLVATRPSANIQVRAGAALWRGYRRARAALGRTGATVAPAGA